MKTKSDGRSRLVAGIPPSVTPALNNLLKLGRTAISEGAIVNYVVKSNEIDQG